ncbi:hypothetical protein DV735_g5620, partial [Chaetothyriales sp. CBS 134920]
MALSLGASWAPILGLLTRRTPATALNASALIPFGASSAAAFPAISIGLSAWLAEAWDGLLKAVPKKKTSHMKRRHRQLAGKALKDLNNINTCPGCGKPKKSHTLCPYCKSKAGGVMPTLQPKKQQSKLPRREESDLLGTPGTGDERRAAASVNGVIDLGRLKDLRRARKGWFNTTLKREEAKERHLVTIHKHPDMKKVKRDVETLAAAAAGLQQVATPPSKQYLSLHTIDDAHSTDVFSLALTPTAILSGSGDAAIKIYSTADDFRLTQVLKDAHRLGCHHIATSKAGDRAVSVGFGGEAKIWKLADGGIWQQDGEIAAAAKAGELWAVCLSADGQYLAGTTHDGRINVWDLLNKCEKIREYETKGSFGISIDLSPDGRFTASGHESGNIYVFSTATSRLLHSLPGLVKPVRSVKFSPGSKLVAAAGDARIIGLYDSNSGEQVAHLTGHAAWITSLDWSHTGQYLLSGSLDGKVKVWDIERRTCVATHSESDKGLWTVKWLPKGDNAVEQRKAERFVTAGSNKAISIYREASGG